MNKVIQYGNLLGEIKKRIQQAQTKSNTIGKCRDDPYVLEYWAHYF